MLLNLTRRLIRENASSVFIRHPWAWIPIAQWDKCWVRRLRFDSRVVELFSFVYLLCRDEMWEIVWIELNSTSPPPWREGRGFRKVHKQQLNRIEYYLLPLAKGGMSQYSKKREKKIDFYWRLKTTVSQRIFEIWKPFFRQKWRTDAVLFIYGNGETIVYREVDLIMLRFE